MKKLTLVLGAVAAATLLTGGVVAAYVITDNANKEGIHITPGSLTDDRTGSVTLSWGDMTSFTNIEGLTAASPITRSINIRADVRDEEGDAVENGVYLGRLDVELRDLSGKAENATKLIDYLSVSVQGYAYANDAFAADKTEQAVLSAAGSLTASIPLYANAAGKQVDFVVSLAAAATPVMGDIFNDQVYLSADWNRAEDANNNVKHVFIPDNGWESMYVYSYTAGGLQNADWPGVQLEKDPQTGLFEATLLEHDYFIFTEAADATDHRYPADGADGMTRAQLAYDTAAAIYFDWENHTFTSVAPQTLAPFYLLGESTAWDIQASYGMELRDGDKPDGSLHQWYLRAEVEANVDFKLRNDEGTLWLGYDAVEDISKNGAAAHDEVPEIPAVVGEGAGDGNFKFLAAGTYEIFLKQYNDYWAIYIASYVPQP